MPTARIDRHLFEAISAVLNQDDGDFELILVLDGVTLPQDYAWLHDERVEVISFADRQGTPRALNAGIEASKGKFVARLDADDVADSTRLRKQREFLENNPDVVCAATAAYLIDDNGVEMGVLDVPSPMSAIRRALLRSNCLVHSSVIYRRDALIRVGMYDPEMTRMQDYELFLRLARAGTLGALTEPLTGYRVHAGQFSRLSSPWALYTRRILRRRMELARELKVSVLVQAGWNAAWFIAQILRYSGLRRPGYLKGI